MAEDEITSSSHKIITGQDLFVASEKYFEGSMSQSMEKVTLLDEADHGHGEAIESVGTTIKDDIEIAALINDVSAAPQVDGSAEDITLRLEKVSSLDALKPAEAFAVGETLITDEDEVISLTHGLSAASEVLMVGETASEAYITLPAEELSLLEAHGSVEVVATGEITNLDKVNTTACPYDDSAITAEKALSEDTTVSVTESLSAAVAMSVASSFAHMVVTESLNVALARLEKSNVANTAVTESLSATVAMPETSNVAGITVTESPSAAVVPPETFNVAEIAVPESLSAASSIKAGEMNLPMGDMSAVSAVKSSKGKCNILLFLLKLICTEYV